MPRYGTDLQTVLDNQKSALSLENTASVATQVLDSLEYLHSMGYVHKDLKGNNLIFKRDHKGKILNFLTFERGPARRRPRSSIS